MTSLASEREDSSPTGEGEDPVVAQPQVFVRAFSVPSGLPWEQARAAQLDARHGSPLPIHELLFKFRRLDRWSPGKPARYGAFYIRAQDYREPFEVVLEVDGRPVAISFGARKQDVDRAKLTTISVLSIVVSGAILGGSIVAATNARDETLAALETLDELALVKRRTAVAYQKQVDQARSLKGAIGRSKSVGDVLADLDWAAASKTTDARISALHWDHGVLAVESRGESPPFIANDRALQRAAAPLRPGVWLWGVQPEPSSRRASSGRQR